MFLENAQEMKSGCVIIGLDLSNALIQGSQWLLQPKAFDRFREFIPPNEPVSQVFNDIIKGEAFGLFNDPVTGESFVVTIRRDDASIMNWAKINFFGKDKTLGSKPSYTKAVIGFMDTHGMGEIGKIINPQGADRIPVVFHLEGDKLWYGFGTVSPKGMVTIFNTVTRKTDTRMEIMPDEIGRGSYLSYNPRHHILSIISSGKFPALQRYYLVGSSGENITTEIKLNIGWNMVSLPVKPLNPTASVLFLGVRVIYGFNEETGYVWITNNETLEVGNGYWILLEEAKKFILTGQFINEYSFEVDEAEWQMIGGCTLPALASIESGNGDIVVIYGYIAGSGYQRVREKENLEPGKGYWLSISGPAKVTIKSIID